MKQQPKSKLNPNSSEGLKDEGVIQDKADWTDVTNVFLSNADPLAQSAHYAIELMVNALSSISGVIDCSIRSERSKLDESAYNLIFHKTGVVSIYGSSQPDPMLLDVDTGYCIQKQEYIVSLVGNNPIKFSLFIRGKNCSATKQEVEHHLRLFSLISGLWSYSERLATLAATDGLTGLYSRTFGLERVRAEIKRMRDTGGTLAFFMLDIDRFKEINDTFGHQVGDRVLSEVGTRIKRYLRDGDIALRYGGEEFLIVIHATTPGTVEMIGKKLNGSIRGKELSDGKTYVTLSVGGVYVSNEQLRKSNMEKIIKQADELLYEAKQERDTWCCKVWQ